MLDIPTEITNTDAVKHQIDKKDYGWVSGKAGIEITLKKKY